MKLHEFYQQVRDISMQMVSPLETEDFIPQPAYFASPPKWNLGHTSWFFEEMILAKYQRNFKPFHPMYNFIFNSYYNTLGERVSRQNRGSLSRPTVAEVFTYRKHIDAQMMSLLDGQELDPALTALVMLGLNHEQQHQELFFTDLKYTFSVNPLYPAYTKRALCEDVNEDSDDFITVEKGLYDIGHSGQGFHFDNERRQHSVFLEDFEIRKSMLTNGEYIEFIENDGYKRFEFWHEEALAWIKEEQITSPMYWQKREDGWYQYTLAGLRKINPAHILTHINLYEAAAFAQWKKMRLPTEFEWEAAADQFKWGQRWEWTESAYLPYPGYQKASGAVGEYNGKFMVNQNVLRGGSVATATGHSRKTYRNFFHASVGYQFNGIRLVRS